MNHDAPSTLHALCQQSWDAGRDPVDDPEVQDFLLAHPQYLEAFAGMRERMNALASLPHSPRQQPRHLRWWLSAAALLLVTFPWWWPVGSGSEGPATTLTPGFLSADYRQETHRSFTGHLVTRETHERQDREHGMYAVLRIEHRTPIHPEAR